MKLASLSEAFAIRDISICLFSTQNLRKYVLRSPTFHINITGLEDHAEFGLNRQPAEVMDFEVNVLDCSKVFRTFM